MFIKKRKIWMDTICMKKYFQKNNNINKKIVDSLRLYKISNLNSKYVHLVKKKLFISYEGPLYSYVYIYVV